MIIVLQIVCQIHYWDQILEIYLGRQGGAIRQFDWRILD